MSMEMMVGPDPVLTPQPLAADGDCTASTPGTPNAVGGVVEQRLRATAKYRESKYSVDVSGLLKEASKHRRWSRLLDLESIGGRGRARLSSRCPERWQSRRSARHRNRILCTYSTEYVLRTYRASREYPWDGAVHSTWNRRVTMLKIHSRCKGFLTMSELSF
jgi:hypothetical protein